MAYVMVYPSLPKCYKNRFPFRLSTTSYIYPDHILQNVVKLAPFVDEIELILFESESQDSLFNEAETQALLNLSSQHHLGFNVHLPLDIFLGDESEAERKEGVSVAKRMIERTLPLNPSVYTLHLDRRNKDGGEERDIELWQKRILRSMKEIAGFKIESNRISIETLEYPFKWVEDKVKEFGFSICLDIGHILTHGQDLKLYLDKYLPKASIIHLHGFQRGIDHLGIDQLSESVLEMIFTHLRNYHGIVSLEVFSIEDLKRSLVTLEEKWGSR
jgi:sugar phosphate isomerase/epimerase